MTSKKNSVSIVYLSIGSGHQVAAEALAEALQLQAPKLDIHTFDPFSQLIDPGILEKFQSASITLTPGLYDSVWRRGTPGNFFERIIELDLLQDTMTKKFQAYESQVVIATHVLPCAISLAIKQDAGLVENVYGVITDFGLHTYWPLSGMDGYFVGHDSLRNLFHYRRMDVKNVYVTGIPIRPSFAKLSGRVHKRSKRLNVLFVVGGIRSGGYRELRLDIFNVLDVLNAFSKENLHLTIVTGNQRKLMQQIKDHTSDLQLDVTVLGFVKTMHELMNQHDILISKPGGVTVAEAMAVGLPIIVLRAGPGQERANTDFLARHGAAVSGESPTNVYEIIQHCLTDPLYLKHLKNNASILGFSQSAQTIAQIVLQKVYNKA
ncbi:MAG: glycosyltransferase [Anaerolineales bacterium]|nr:glycosyltransferase [Anaerolineales bacterium]